MSGNENESAHDGGSGVEMETTSTVPQAPAGLGDLDPVIQAEILKRINEQVALHVRASLAAFPGQTSTAGHAAGSQSDQATDGRRPLGEMSFNWGSSTPTDTSTNQAVSSLEFDYDYCRGTSTIPKVSKAPIQPGSENVPNRKRQRSASPVRDDHSGANKSCAKKRRFIEGSRNKDSNKRLKQMNLENFFQKRVNTRSLDLQNLAHLVALDTEIPSLTQDMSEESINNRPDKVTGTSNPTATLAETGGTPDNTNRETSPKLIPTTMGMNDEIYRTKIREPILFKDPNPTEFVPILNEKNEVDREQLRILMHEIEKHNMKLYDLCEIRARQQLYEKKSNREATDRGILSKITAEVTMGNINKGNNPDKINRPQCGTRKNIKNHKKTENVSNDNLSLSLSKQEGEEAMPDGARSTWNRSRNAAVDACKAKTRATFYREAPNKGLIEYWCFGLEKTPGYLMKLGPFRTALQQLRLKQAKDIMELAADHLDRETKRQNDSASAMKSAAIELVYKVNTQVEAKRIVDGANLSYDITIANMYANEYRDLEKRRSLLEQSPPSAGDILDPAANVAKTTAKANPTSGNPSAGRGFQQRGRGRGGPRPWRNQRGRKPYERPARN